MLRGKHAFVIKILGIITAGLMLVVLGLYLEVKDTVQLISPSATVLLEDRYGGFLSESGGRETDELGYWDVPEPLPERIETAFLAIEDRRFYEHPGVDWWAIGRAMWNNLTNSRRQGASTIAMQVARMQGSGTRRTYWAKLCESVTALLLIHKFGHQAVLQQYLELVPQGNRIHGVAYAVRRYFQKPLQDVSWAEAAVLAALPKAPGRMNLYQPEGRTQALARASIILAKLRDNGTLNQEQWQAAQQQLRTLTIPEKETRPEYSYHAILRLEDVLRQQNGKRPRTSFFRPFRATLDLQVQEKVAEITGSAIDHYRPSGAGNIAAMVVEKETGNVVAYVGSDDYGNTKYAGAINYAGVRRSSGSTLKPFIYALGLESGKFTPASLLSDAPFLISLPRGYHQVGNYDGQNFGFMLYRKALTNSRNVPAVHVLMKVGIDHVYEFFRQLGLVENERTAEYYGLGMAIGTLYITLEDLVTAYGVLANEGKAFRLRWFDEEKTEPQEEYWLSQDAARQISLFLSDPLARLPVFSRMGPLGYPFPVAVKTGTSQGFRDAWAVAYSSRYIVGVWMGHPDHTRMNEVSGTDAAQAVKNIMLFLHPEERRGVEEHPFPPPENYTLVQICAPTGRRATDACPEVFPEYFRPGTEPPAQAESFMASFLSQDAKNVSQSSRTGALVPFSLERLFHASITIREPKQGGTFVIDPDTPRAMQTLSLQAQVRPTVHKIVWHVNGKPFEEAAYPYTVRWPLTPGTHTIQARFAHANIISDVVTITVY